MIEIKQVSKKIRRVPILSDISLNVEQGQVVGLRGPNGSGKTMLMRCVAGLVRPTSGAVVIDGKQLHRDIAFPKSIGLLIENPSLLENRCAFSNLKILASIKGLTKEKQIRDTLIKVGLNPDDKRAFRKYSLGMKQRLGLAAAVLESPRILLLDEPTNALDSDGVEMFRSLLQREKARGAAILLTSHDGALLEELSDDIYEMREGGVLNHA